jgi:hypothetical protein
LLLIANLVVLSAILLIGMIGLRAKSPSPPANTAVLGGEADDAITAMTVRDLGPGDGGKHWYDISYTATLQNRSSSDFLVPWSLDELFLGDLKQPKDGVALINAPPAPTAEAPQGSVGWKLIASQAGYLWTEEALDLGDDSVDENDITSFLKEAHVSEENSNAGLMGLYPPGRSNAHTAHFRFQALPEQYASAMISYGATTRPPMFGDPPDFLWDTRRTKFEMVRLADATAAQCPLGLIIAKAQPREACPPPAAPAIR